MTSLPPKIDQRTYEDIVEQAKELAQKYTVWQPANNEEKDAGEALIRIFGKMVKSVSDRLNKVPDKNFLAFLDLIGGRLKPPQPAKVPLTFYLAEGSTDVALVPAYTQISAPPTEGSDEEIVFETDEELVVTTAQLKAVFVTEPNQDKYQDRILEANGEKDEAFKVFAGNDPIEHSLYLTCPEIFNLPELANLQLILTTDNTNQFPREKFNWFYWDGSQWIEESPDKILANGELTFTFTNLPILTPTEIQGKTGKWLRSQVTNLLEELPEITKIQGRISIEKSNLVPDICLFNSSPLDLTKDFYPFGEQPKFNDTFYLALHDLFVKPNATITLNIIIKPRKIQNYSSATITWEIGDGEEWKEISESNSIVTWSGESPNFTIENTNAELQFIKPPKPSTVNGETRYWIRGRIKEGHYGIEASERTYPIYQDLAILAGKEETETSTIKVDSVDLFKTGDSIRILPNTSGFPEEHTIASINSNDLTLNTPIINDNLPVGARIMRKLIVTENIPPIYDPPLIQSLKLTYEFTLTEEANYFANNNYIYSHPQPLTTFLKEKVNSGDKLLNLAEVEGLTVGQYLKINDENYQIETINSQMNQVLLTSKVKEDYNKNTSVEYVFRPFTTTVDKEPTLYLGFDESFDNKTVTLYAQVESPLAEEVSKEITTETFLKRQVNKGGKTLTIDDITGWEQGDFLQLELKKNSQSKEYSSYTISNIDQENKEITVKEDIQEDYSEGSRVFYSTEPELVWEYSSDLGWQILGIKDETKNFSQRGIIQFIAPPDLSKMEKFGQQLFWLRVRWTGGNFRVKPRLRRLLTNTIWAFHRNTIREEVLGSSNSDPHQVFMANNSPILPGQKLEVQEEQIPPELESDQVKVIRDDIGETEEIWVQWLEVTDFYGSGAGDRHYTLDRQTGEIRFGDGHSGMIPPRGRNNIRLSLYRTGGGKQGNVASETISQLKTTIPYIDRGINLEPSAGGAKQETLDSLKERVPKTLRHRHRAVTAQDMADLAYEASTDVARVKVVTPDMITNGFSPLNVNLWLDPSSPNITSSKSLDEKLTKVDQLDRESFRQMMEEINRRAGQVKLIVLPDSKVPQPIPSIGLLEQVATYIRARCEETTNIIVSGPQWLKISVTAKITPVSFVGVDLIRNKVKQRLEIFLHPLTGGSGNGWQFGRRPKKSDFYALIQAIAGVDHVDSLVIDDGSTEDNSDLNADTLIFSGSHTININLTRR